MDLAMEAIKLLSLPQSKCNKIVSLLRCATKKKVIVVGGPAGCACGGWPGCSSWNLLLLSVCIFALWLNAQLCQAAPSAAANETAWPPMRHYDIWTADLKASAPSEQQLLDVNMEMEKEFELIDEQNLLQDTHSYGPINKSNNNSSRQSKVIHLFPVPVDGECLSDDGRRFGNCFNAYECRQKGGQAKGECAMGFGVCCVFVASCNGTITNNITYIVSPEFPSFMPSNFTGCQIKIKMMSEDISQLRIDFYHFSLGQPNRRTGVCEGDIFNISGGPGGPFALCGQNSGQHLYYDVGVRSLPRQTTLYGSLRPTAVGNVSNVMDQTIEINLDLSSRYLPIRLWEIRVSQIPFSQRAPAGCLQYHTGIEGVMQTFNFADNGRHLANQNYRICVRQETDMCSIMYQPCDEQSFRIGGGGNGGSFMSGMNSQLGSSSFSTVTAGQAQPATVAATTFVPLTAATVMRTTSSVSTTSATTTAAPTSVQQLSSNATTAATVAADDADDDDDDDDEDDNNDDDDDADDDASASSSSSTTSSTTPIPVRSSTAAATQESTAADDETDPEEPANDDADEGSGGGGGFFDFFGGSWNAPTTARTSVSRRPRPVGGGGSSVSGFDFLGFLRSAFDLRARRQARQFYSTCTDRITMPCIIEDFIGTGLGPLPGCEPVHCGAQFCSTGAWPCRIESTVTPFYIGVHFGRGDDAGKGSAEENIGACLRYSQVQCI